LGPRIAGFSMRPVAISIALVVELVIAFVAKHW
jgi:hypothetical protein